MKQNFTVRHGALDGVEAFLSVARHKSFRRGRREVLPKLRAFIDHARRVPVLNEDI